MDILPNSSTAVGIILISTFLLAVTAQHFNVKTLFFGLYVPQFWQVSTVAENTKNHHDESREPPTELRNVITLLRSCSLHARATTPGARIFRWFLRVNNPFSSASPEMQHEYRAALTHHFNGIDGHAWEELTLETSKAVKSLVHKTQTSTGHVQNSLNVRDACRLGQLAAILKQCFELTDVPIERLQYIGSETHRLAIAKKTFDQTKPDPDRPDLMPAEDRRDIDLLIDDLCDLVSETRDRAFLTQHLLCTVSGTPDDFNPLNLILAAYEAPWRGVYYTVLSVLQDKETRRDEIVALLDSYPDKPLSPAALAIVYESLRLYPPIRRNRTEHIIVDLEARHRDPQSWGSDAADWNPSRFLNEDGTIKRSRLTSLAGFLPFSIGRFACPADKFSLRMMAVLSGEILRQVFPSGMHDDWCMQGEEWDDSARQGCALRPGREEYTGVDIVYPDQYQ